MRLITVGKRPKQRDTNEPDRRGDCRNRFLRMSRTAPRSRCGLVPRPSNRCCKTSLLRCQGEQRVRNDSSANAETQHQATRSTISCGIDEYADVEQICKLNLALNDTQYQQDYRV